MRKSLLLMFSLIIFVNIHSQNSFEPVNKPVYLFLERMSVKGLINSDEFVKPLLRKDITRHLLILHDKQPELNKIEKDELNWYLGEYSREFKDESESNSEDLVFLKKRDDRFHFLFYSDSLFSLSFNPSVYTEYRTLGDESVLMKGWGFSSYGNIGDNFGFRIDFNDNSLDNNKFINFLDASPLQGNVYIVRNEKSVEFSRTNGSLLYSNDWFLISASKENLRLGSGVRGNIILSDKSPSFPSVYLRLTPVDWFSLFSFHGWLNSGVIDSVNSYRTDLNNNMRYVERAKYIALHAVQIRPFGNLSLTIGESMVYSDRNIYWGYFIPFLFYRAVDHAFTYGRGDSGNNGSFFFDFVYYPVNSLKSYLSLYIDELSLSQLLKGNTSRNQLGFTLGSSVYVPFLENTTFTAEYTRILPWVYSNWISSQTYRNAGYLLGHYIGQNSDQLFLQMDYRLIRGLEFKLWGEMIRQGGFDDVSNQYTDPGEPFLYGLRRNESNIGFDVRYEYIHDLFAEFNYKYSDISDEDTSRTPGFMLGKQHSFSVGFYYGL